MLTLSQPMAINEAGADSGIERRRGLRIQQTRPIKVFEPTGSRYFGGQTQDVSSTGLRLQLPCSMPVCPGKLLIRRANAVHRRGISGQHLGATRRGVTGNTRNSKLENRMTNQIQNSKFETKAVSSFEF